MTRTIYGADEVYVGMDWDSLSDWRWLASFGASTASSCIFSPKAKGAEFMELNDDGKLFGARGHIAGELFTIVHKPGNRERYRSGR